MEPQPLDPVKEQSKKDNSGCIYLLLKLAAVVSALFLLEYVVSYIFQSIYKPDELSRTFIPFQNHYLANTNMFITDEPMSSEFSEDVTATGRFLARSIIVIPIVLFVSALLYQIPPIKRNFNTVFWCMFGPAVLATLLDATFFPNVKTVFDVQSKTMTIIRYSFLFQEESKVIPFSQIKDFDHEVEIVDGHDHDEDIAFAEIHAIVGEEHIFIGENQVGNGSSVKTVGITADKQKEVDDVLNALRKMIK